MFNAKRLENIEKRIDEQAIALRTITDRMEYFSEKILRLEKATDNIYEKIDDLKRCIMEMCYGKDK